MLFEFYGVKRCRERGEQNGADDRLHDVEGRFGYSRGNVVEYPVANGYPERAELFYAGAAARHGEEPLCGDGDFVFLVNAQNGPFGGYRDRVGRIFAAGGKRFAVFGRVDIYPVGLGIRVHGRDAVNVLFFVFGADRKRGDEGDEQYDHYQNDRDLFHNFPSVFRDESISKRFLR